MERYPPRLNQKSATFGLGRAPAGVPTDLMVSWLVVFGNAGAGTLGHKFRMQSLALIVVSSQEKWARIASVNAYSGAVHPLVHEHPVSGKKARFLYRGR